jgi:hypothetical protein
MSGSWVKILVHWDLAEQVPCLGILHVVCVGKVILVPLLLALAYRARVPIFDVKATRVAHVLVHVPFIFVHIHFVGGTLSLLRHSLDVWN